MTNYLSAHDTDNSLSVDKYLDEDGEEITSASEASAHGSSSIASVSDSIWNFHLWNEVWAKRPDLSDKEGIFDGWQVGCDLSARVKPRVYHVDFTGG